MILNCIILYECFFHYMYAVWTLHSCWWRSASSGRYTQTYNPGPFYSNLWWVHPQQGSKHTPTWWTPPWWKEHLFKGLVCVWSICTIIICLWVYFTHRRILNAGLEVALLQFYLELWGLFISFIRCIFYCFKITNILHCWASRWSFRLLFTYIFVSRSGLLK